MRSDKEKVIEVEADEDWKRETLKRKKR